MPISEIQHLALLLSAESEKVRDMVLAELRQHREHIEPFLATAPPLGPDELFLLHEIIREYKSENVRSSWLSWTSLGSQYLQLEKALDFLAHNEGNGGTYPPLSELLDKLVSSFLRECQETTIANLSNYLFGSQRLLGAKEDYFNPLHSNLCYVLQEGKGLPISLSCIMILVGYRLGLEVYGFNLPGHFMVRGVTEGRMVLIDCFNGGKQLSQGEIGALSLSPKVSFQELCQEEPTASEMVTRVLVNLINAYHRNGNMPAHFFTQDLLADLRHFMNGKTQLVSENKKETLFQPGQLIRHKSHGYRGLVVDMDLNCTADDSWYNSNHSKPDKNQPWYHILVDGSSVTTYAAQSNLEKDPNPGELTHPLIPLYFQGFHNGSYRRNNVPWSL